MTRPANALASEVGTGSREANALNWLEHLQAKWMPVRVKPMRKEN